MPGRFREMCAHAGTFLPSNLPYVINWYRYNAWCALRMVWGSNGRRCASGYCQGLHGICVRLQNMWAWRYPHHLLLLGFVLSVLFACFWWKGQWALFPWCQRAHAAGSWGATALWLTSAYMQISFLDVQDQTDTSLAPQGCRGGWLSVQVVRRVAQIDSRW